MSIFCNESNPHGQTVQAEQAAAPIGEATPQPAAPSPVAAAPAPGKVELPSSDADYLQNPKPAYPRISQRLGERGKVVVRVLIGVDGLGHAFITHKKI